MAIDRRRSHRIWTLIAIVGVLVMAALNFKLHAVAQGSTVTYFVACFAEKSDQLYEIEVSDNVPPPDSSCREGDRVLRGSDGDIAAVIPGFGLSGGAASGDAGVSADPTILQRRIGSSCPAGTFMTGVAEDGSVTCQPPAFQPIQRIQQLGTVFDPITPVATWNDVPGALITSDFDAGAWKASFAATLRMSGGNGTAHLRFQVRPQGGGSFEVGQNTLFRFQSPLPTTEASTDSVFIQALLQMPGGVATIAPQVYSNDPTWALADPVLIVEH